MTNVSNLVPTNKFVFSCFMIELQINKYCIDKNSPYFYRKLEKLLPLIIKAILLLHSFYSKCCKTFKLVHIYTHGPNI